MEILTVIAIIVILIGIGIPAYNSWRNRAQIARAKAVIQQLEMALEMYKSDIGYYLQKTTSNNLNADGLINQYLVNSFTVSGITYGPYMKFDGNLSNNALLDPWGNAYNVFTAPGSVGDADFRHNTSSCYIYSFGVDGNNNTADDIDNYKI